MRLVLVIGVLIAAGTGRLAPRGDSYSGVAEFDQAAWLSTATSGLVARTSAKIGDVVSVGDAILSLDAEVQQRRVEIARINASNGAEIEELTVLLEESQAHLERTESASSAVPVWELMRAKAGVRIAEARLDAAREKVRVARAQLAYEEALLGRHELRAPFAGTVIDIATSLGESVTPSDDLVHLVATDRLRVSIQLPPDLVGVVRVGKACPLNVDLPDAPACEAVVTFVAPVLDPGSQTFRCDFSIDNSDGRIPAGAVVILDRLALETDRLTAESADSE